MSFGLAWSRKDKSCYLCRPWN